MPSAVRVFISYHHKDATVAERLMSTLRAAGATIWIDHESLTPGTPNWQLAIREGIEQAGAVIYLASPAAARSPFVYDEINLARSTGRRVIPLWIDGQSWPDCVPLGWGATQYIDARASRYTAALAGLLAALGLSSVSPASPAPSIMQPALPISPQSAPPSSSPPESAAAPSPLPSPSAPQSSSANSSPPAPPSPQSPPASPLAQAAPQPYPLPYPQPAAPVDRAAATPPSSVVPSTPATPPMPALGTPPVRSPLPSPTPTPPSHTGAQVIAAPPIAGPLPYIPPVVQPQPSVVRKRPKLTRRAMVTMIVSLSLASILVCGVSVALLVKLVTAIADVPATGTVTWKTGLVVTGQISPLASNGLVYVISGGGNLFALDATNGDLSWKTHISPPNSGLYTVPVLSGGVVYFIAGDGTVYALNATTGSSMWDNTQISSDLSGGSPAVVDGMTYVAGNDGTIYALNAATGATDWHSSFPFSIANAVGGSIAGDGGMVYFVGNDHYLYALNAATGASDWIVPIGCGISQGGSVTGSLAVAHGVLAYDCSDGSVYALDASTGDTTWHSSVPPVSGTPPPGSSNGASSPTIANGVIYTGSGSNANLVFAYDAGSGHLRWTATLGGYVLGAPTIANGLVYVGTSDGDVYTIDAATGTIRTKTPTSSQAQIFSSSAVEGGTAFISATDGNIYAVKP